MIQKQNQSIGQLVGRPGSALLILLGGFFFFLCIFSLLSSLLLSRIENVVVATRLMTLFQAIFLFIVPALLTAVLSTRYPARLLCIDRCPKILPVAMIFMTLVVAIPAMNCIIEWNNGLKLPEAFHDLEKSMRAMEDAAQNATSLLIGHGSVSSLIVSLLIVGVMAGLSEELFFRGALQRVLGSTRLGAVGAIWMAAIIFSFMHFQFYGFVPRLLLGVFFGYILLWGDNLWYCIIAHAVNNMMAVYAAWSTPEGEINAVDSLGQLTGDSGPNLLIVVVSVILTALSIVMLKRTLKKY